MERGGSLQLGCDVINDPLNPPLPLPTPTRSWFKDGELIYSALLDDPPDASKFLMNNTIFVLGVLDPATLTLPSDGKIYYNTQVVNITSPSLIAHITTIDQAREEVFDFVLGNWTCVVSNNLGTVSLQHIISECGKYSLENLCWLLHSRVSKINTG